MDNRPIGVFDSGLGGLTVVKELNKLLKNESIIYFGDTGRVPYGTRSRETIEKYARQDEEFLLSKNVKMIIAACGTVSSVAPHTGDNLPVPFLGVVNPTAKLAAQTTKNGKIGVIGTTATILSNAYNKILMQIDKSFQVYSQHCPLFVPLVEAGWINDDEIAYLCAKRYLDTLIKAKVDTLILGCTHYPLLSQTISKVMGDGVTLINSGNATVLECAKILSENDLLCADNNKPKHTYYITDRPEGFLNTAQLLLQDDIKGSVFRVSVG